MTSLVLPVRVFIDPFDGTRAIVETHRWVWPLLILALCVSASGIFYSLRWDAAPDVIRELQANGELKDMSEADLTENIETATRKALVGGIAKGVFLMPLATLLLACVLWVAAWLFDTPAPFARLMTAAAVALLPIALYYLIHALCVAAQYSLPEARAERLVPAHLGLLVGPDSPRLQRVLTTLDFFNLWSVLLLGLGFSAASGMRRGRALLLALVMYAMFAGITMIGLPAGGGP